METDAADLAEAMLQAALAGGLELRAHKPHFILEPGPRPIASALARLQIESGPRVSTLLHRIVTIDDEFSRLFLRLLDGAHDRDALREALLEAAGGGQAAGASITAESITNEEIDRVLHRLARLGLLVA